MIHNNDKLVITWSSLAIITKYEELVKYFPNVTLRHAITTTYYFFFHWNFTLIISIIIVTSIITISLFFWMNKNIEKVTSYKIEERHIIFWLLVFFTFRLKLLYRWVENPDCKKVYLSRSSCVKTIKLCNLVDTLILEVYYDCSFKYDCNL